MSSIRITNKRSYEHILTSASEGDRHSASRCLFFWVYTFHFVLLSLFQQWRMWRSLSTKATPETVWTVAKTVGRSGKALHLKSTTLTTFDIKRDRLLLSCHWESEESEITSSLFFLRSMRQGEDAFQKLNPWISQTQKREPASLKQMASCRKPGRNDTHILQWEWLTSGRGSPEEGLDYLSLEIFIWNLATFQREILCQTELVGPTQNRLEYGNK